MEGRTQVLWVAQASTNQIDQPIHSLHCLVDDHYVLLKTNQQVALNRLTTNRANTHHPNDASDKIMIHGGDADIMFGATAGPSRALWSQPT